MIYFDNAATTFPKPESVYLELDKINRTAAFNAGRGESAESEMASDLVQKARKAVASFIPQIDPSRVVFTSSATEALNLLILGMDLADGDTVYISPFEHNAIVRPLKRLEKEKGIRIEVIPFDKNTWSLDLNALRQAFVLRKPSAVFLSQISNVTGYALPYKQIFQMSKQYSAINVLDAAQGYGVFPVSDWDLCSYIVFAGHKSLYGSFGVAGFLVVDDHNLAVIKSGGTGSDSLNPEMPEQLPGRYEAGSLDVVAIASLIPSIQFLHSHDVAKNETELSEYFKTELKKLPEITVYCPEGVVSHGIVSFDVAGHSSEEMGILLGEKGFSVRTGYHCAPLVHEFISSLRYLGTVRCSFGAFNNKKEVDFLVAELKKIG
jgi:selenocysteine lyase/cysteine desulfurase